MTRSFVWKYFVKRHESSHCKLCGTVYRHCGATTSLKHHLLHAHQLSQPPQPPSYYSEKFHLEKISQEIPHRISTQKDWLTFDIECYVNFNGGTALRKNSSLSTIFRNNFPEYYWDKIWPGPVDKENERLYLDKLVCSYLKFVETEREMERITKNLFVKYPGGLVLADMHRRNVQLIFNKNYPELNVDGKKANNGFWSQLKNNNLVPKIVRSYCVRSKEDWYKLSIEQIGKVYGKGVSRKNLIHLLGFWYGEEEWDCEKFSECVGKKARQRLLGLKLMELFKDEVIFEEFVFGVMDRYIFDFYLPGRNLVVEYQGEQHYLPVWKWKDLEEQKMRDQEKFRFCKENNLNLVYVPYWWDAKTTSLKDLFIKSGTASMIL
eukprot:TRINITY_DN6915_c0_g1_i1.p1 TRINITY_DN6915_c0_g1~~TRINITY_DN6915_c0_g1_i1.p1  ORF type:complete len:377 (-),score=77.98 TRINITY_DN6915_c0_g1_i1:2-1132(-)